MNKKSAVNRLSFFSNAIAFVAIHIGVSNVVNNIKKRDKPSTPK
jgi:hypothetical protein